MKKMPNIKITIPIKDSEASKEDAAVRLDFEESREAEELWALNSDLDFVIGVSEHLLTLAESRRYPNVEQNEDIQVVRQSKREYSQSENRLMDRALWVAALVTYVRCFTSGKRIRLDESIFEGHPEHVLKEHRYFKDVRDKHIAHSVNAFEDYASVARVANIESDTPQVRGVYNLVNNMTGERPEHIRNLGELAKYAQYFVGEKLKKVDRKISTRLKSLTPEELRALPRFEMGVKQGFDAAKSPRD